MATVAVSLTPATTHPVYVCLLVTYSICCTLSRCTVCYNPASCHLPTTEESWEEGHEAEGLEPKRNAFMGGRGMSQIGQNFMQVTVASIPIIMTSGGFTVN